jgi:hypothetical protein
MKVGRAVAAGLVGGVSMTILAWVVRQIGIDMNPEMMFGTMVSPAGMAAWLAGFAMHVILSVLIALLYAWGFEHVVHRSGLVAGLGFSLIHLVVAGAVMAMLPAIHPAIPEKMPAPGAFMANMGGTFVALFVLEHLLYGGIVGAMYGPVATRRPAPTTAL